MVRVVGLEPTRYCYRGILSPLCLPFHHTRNKVNYTGHGDCFQVDFAYKIIPLKNIGRYVTAMSTSSRLITNGMTALLIFPVTNRISYWQRTG